MMQSALRSAGLRRGDWLAGGVVAFGLHLGLLLAVQTGAGGGGAGGAAGEGAFDVVFAPSPLAEAAAPAVPAPDGALPRPPEPVAPPPSVTPNDLAPVSASAQPPRAMLEPADSVTVEAASDPAGPPTGAATVPRMATTPMAGAPVDLTAPPPPPPPRRVAAMPTATPSPTAPTPPESADGARREARAPALPEAGAARIRPVPRPEVRAAAPAAPVRTSTTRAAPAPPSRSPAQTAAAAPAGRGAGPAGDSPAPGPGGDADALKADYRAHVFAQLARVQRYPPLAQRRGIEGRGRLSLSIAADGRLIGASVVGSTGLAVLDREMGAMARRAAPFDPPPAGTETPVTLVANIQFALR